MASWGWWPKKVAGSPPNVHDTMVAWGVEQFYFSDDPYAPIYKQVIPQANPGISFSQASYGYPHATWTAAGFTGATSGAGAWEIFCEMCLRCRCVFFSEQTIGDCGLPFIASNNAAESELLSAGLSFGASFSPIPIPGLGALVGWLSGANHQQAVANEKAELCGVCSQASQDLQNCYALFDAGEISASDAYAYVKQLAANVQSDIQASGVAIKSCNASCGVIGIMAAHVAFAAYAFGIQPFPGLAIPARTVQTPATANTAAPAPAQAQVSAPSSAAVPSSSFSLQSVPVWLIVAIIGILVLAAI